MEFRHANTYRLPRGKRSDPPWPGGPVAFAWSPSQVVQAERRRLVRPPRGRFLSVPFVVAVVPSTWTPTTRKTRILRYALQRRGQLYDPPWVVTTVASAWRPEFISERRVRTYLRRAKRQEFLAQQVPVPISLSRRRQVGYVRRGRVSTPPWAQTVVQVSTWLPTNITHRNRVGFAKRGHRFDPPWPGAALNAFLWLPKQLPRRLRITGLLPRRGRRADVISAQAVTPVTVWTPQPIGKRARLMVTKKRGQRVDHIPGQPVPKQQIAPRRVRVVSVRRSLKFPVIPMQFAPVQVIARVHRLVYQVRRPTMRRAMIVAAQMVPVQVVQRSRQRLQYLRRGKRFNFTIFIPPPPNVWRPGIIRSRWAKGFHKRRKTFGSFLVHNAARVFPAISTGETDRPEGGTTSRAQAGETENPSEGDVL